MSDAALETKLEALAVTEKAEAPAPEAPAPAADEAAAAPISADGAPAATPAADDPSDAAAADASASPAAEPEEDAVVARHATKGLEQDAEDKVTVEGAELAPGIADCVERGMEWKMLHLPPQLIANVEGLGWKGPAKVQATAIPTILSNPGRSIVVQSPNGSGKTGTFGCCIAYRIATGTGITGPQCVVLSPTKDLAEQTAQKLMGICTGMGIKVQLLVGGVMYNKTVDAQVIVGTPGKIKGELGNWRKIIDLKNVHTLVVDEADDIILNQRQEILAIKQGCSRNVQVCLFSASFECWEPDHPDFQNARKFSDQFLGVPPVPCVIRVGSDVAPTVTHFRLDLAPALPPAPSSDWTVVPKAAVLADLLNQLGDMKAVVFTKTQKSAHKLAEILRSRGLKPSVSTGMSKALSGRTADAQARREAAVLERSRTLDEFNRGVTKLLIATDVLARGIDVLDLKLVVNFEVPYYHSGFQGKWTDVPDKPKFQHRCGRVGRFGKVGAVLHVVAHDPLTGDKEARDYVTLFNRFQLTDSVRALPIINRDMAECADMIKDATRKIPAQQTIAQEAPLWKDTPEGAAGLTRGR